MSVPFQGKSGEKCPTITPGEGVGHCINPWCITSQSDRLVRKCEGLKPFEFLNLWCYCFQKDILEDFVAPALKMARLVCLFYKLNCPVVSSSNWKGAQNTAFFTVFFNNKTEGQFWPILKILIATSEVEKNNVFLNKMWPYYHWSAENHGFLYLLAVFDIVP